MQLHVNTTSQRQRDPSVVTKLKLVFKLRNCARTEMKKNKELETINTPYINVNTRTKVGPKYLLQRHRVTLLINTVSCGGSFEKLFSKLLSCLHCERCKKENYHDFY